MPQRRARLGGHDGDVTVSADRPHVAGHELVGRVVAVGTGVDPSWVGRRTTTPFVCACGRCAECRSGDGQVCSAQTQPGFTHHGSWAEQVLVHDAATNLVEVPDDVDAGAAALMGCRFATAHRALAQLARVRAGEVVLVLGCGGVGLSAVMIAAALGADVVAADVDPAALERATARWGRRAAVATRGLAPAEVAEAVRGVRPAGAAVSLDAAGRPETMTAGLLSLARRGRHVQVGLLAADPVVPVAADGQPRAVAAGEPRHGRPCLPGAAGAGHQRAARPRRARRALAAAVRRRRRRGPRARHGCGHPAPRA